MTTIEDRRKFERVAVTSSVKSTLLDGDVSYPCAISNIAKRGVCLKTELNRPLGSFVRIKLFFEETGADLEVEGRLMWKRGLENCPDGKFEWGLLLMNWLDSQSLEKIVETVQRNIYPERRHKVRRLAAIDSFSGDKRNFDRRLTGNTKTHFQEMSQAWDRFESFHRYGRVIQSNDGATVLCHGKRKIMLGSNNYLGLTNHPLVKEAAIKATEKYGTGAGGSRVLSGTTQIHRELEEKLAEFKGAEACHIFNSGFVANFALMTSLVGKNDVIFNDQTNHASIIDGCRASEGIVRHYKHGNCENLEKKLASYPLDQKKVIVTDGVFSMDGDIAPLKEIHALAKKYNAMLVVDDAHATGMIGPTGRGTAEYHGIEGKVDVTVVTLSKSLGSIGGAVCGSKALIKYLFHRSRPFIFATSLPPSAIAAASAALDVLIREPELLIALEKNREYFLDGLCSMGYKVVPSPTAIIPMIIGDEVKAYRMATLLDEFGVFANAVSRPSVPRELSRIRVTVMATHTKEHLDQALDAFNKAGKQLNVI